ncbi:hypothetical protein [Dokdonia donghaensis]|uniref:DUF4377 domain-containing protein n=1 Tax=Dokdonia donghaensis DSW-1 TaxID=1300343 RepID=A0A0A2GUW5_9FLAO|nr:hypothetical protein [Dokdonia donghaensis]ANH61505.1 hypothetical protein I597_2608 [Dokdonia donghaensis DSW-1]KGO06111.1 hypothetical protein NV36_04175 [Dokdonia donghaensis DSW-1]
MKTLFIALFTLTTIAYNTTSETVTATFTGYSDETYYFTDSDDLTYAFESISAKAAQEFDLTQDTYKGQQFKITFTTSTELNEDDEEYDMLSITALELVK